MLMSNLIELSICPFKVHTVGGVQGPIVQKTVGPKTKVGGPLQDEFVEYMLYNTNMQ